MTWVPIWLDQTDLESATSAKTVLACFDDGNTGSVNAVAVADVITRAEMHTLSFLDEYGPPPFASDVLGKLGADPFLASAAQEIGVIFMYDRAPEAVRQAFGDLQKRRKDWEALMTRIKDARQRPPTVPIVPANVGGVARANLNRIFADNPNGPDGGNAGDY